jgi:methyl-accepting chemotaxis protein
MTHEERTDDRIQNLEVLGNAVAKYLPVLDAVDLQLRETAAQIETAVVGVCGNFAAMANRTRSSISQASEFLAGNKGQPGGTISLDELAERAQSTMAELLRHGRESQAISEHAVSQIRVIEKAAGTITYRLSQLDAISRGNKLLAVNARIQAVSASKGEKGFNAVANEIASQARQSTEIVGDIREVALDLNKVAVSASKELTGMSDADQKSFETSRSEVERALNEFQRVHHSMEQMVARMTEESRLVAKEISEAVQALQFQDRVNQRIGHIAEQLDQIGKELGALCPHSSPEVEAALAHFSSRFTMHEERNLLTGAGDVTHGGEVELF